MQSGSEESGKKALIVGLGNPGEAYQKTRHNLGQMVLSAFAKKHQLSFKRERAVKGQLAKGEVGERRVFLLFPTTYMNLSGGAVIKALRFCNLSIKELLVLSDDSALPFGMLRYRPKGSSGGHNGLKDIAEKLGTQEYARLRLGIGEPSLISLERYVLQRFTEEEEKKIDEIAAEASCFIEEWLSREKEESK